MKKEWESHLHAHVLKEMKWDVVLFIFMLMQSKWQKLIPFDCGHLAKLVMNHTLAFDEDD